MTYHLFYFQQCTFWSLVIFFTILDYLTKKKSLINIKSYFLLTILNTIFISLPLGLLIHIKYDECGILKTNNVGYEFDKLCGQLIRLILAVLLEDVYFYYIHRTFHAYSFLYKPIHSLHHQVTSPIAISALYVSPLEHIFLNVLPVLLIPIVVGFTLHSIYLWFLLVNLSSVISHSGYVQIPGVKDHDNHHKFLNCNYGTIGIVDCIHKTNN